MLQSPPMGSATQAFSPDLLNNFFGLKRFVSGDEEIRQIRNEKITSSPNSQELYFGRWRVVWITIKAPFEYLISYILLAIAAILRCLTTRGSRFFTVLSKQTLRDQVQLGAQTLYQERLLVPSLNVHQTWSCDFYGRPDLPIDFIRDPIVRKMTFLEQFIAEGKSTEKPSLHILNFYHSNGICRGAVCWFFSLFSKTEGQFATSKEHLIAVARQFEAGIPRQAVLFQTLDAVAGPLFDLKRELWPETIAPLELTDKLPSALEKVRAVPPGLYYVGLHRHAIAYIKCSEQTGYIWDPIFGAIDITGPEQAQLLLDRILLQHDPETAKGFVYFEALTPSQEIKIATG